MAAQQKGEIEETELKVSSTLPAPPPPTSPPQQQQQISVMSDLKLSDDRSTDLKTCVKDQSTSPAQQQLQQQVSVVSNVKFSDRTILITDLKSCKVDDESSSSSVSSRKRQREEVSRCSGRGCRRKIGLMPFRCRCGEVFCPEHRYSDRHDCNYDYKSAGREAIAKENPVVKAAKIIKV